MQEFDVIVIGSGPGGYVAAIRAAQLGLKTACVEKEKQLGGTCLNVGCIPSKTLLQSTEHYAWLLHEAATHGISFSEAKINFGSIMKRKEQVVLGLTQGIDGLFKRHGITRLTGAARFVNQHEIEVNGEKVKGKHFILATGSEPIPLPFLPFDEKIVISSTGALQLPSVPKTMAVIGGGVIGVELASVYSRLGTEITIIEMLDDICVGMDSAVSKGLLQALKKEKMTFHLGTKLTKAEKKNRMILTAEQKGQTLQIEADVVLVAIGRRPYTTGLSLDTIAIKSDRGFISVDGNFRTNVPHIFAIGDLISGPMLAHKASEEGVAVAEIIAGKSPHVNYMAIPNVIYTHPEAASLGLTEKEARDMGLDIVIGTASYRGNPRARCSGYTEGFVKVIGAGKSRTLVGLHMLGFQVSEMINSGVLAIEKRTTLAEIAQSPQAHPTLSEAIKEACGAALGIAIHS